MRTWQDTLNSVLSELFRWTQTRTSFHRRMIFSRYGCPSRLCVSLLEPLQLWGTIPKLPRVAPGYFYRWGSPMAMHLITDLQDNYDRFVTRVRQSKVVWGLKSEDGWANCPSNEYDCDVILFWSDEAYAKRLAANEWANYRPTMINFDDFVDKWLRGMHQDGVLAGVNFNADLAGLEIEPIELAQALTAEP